MKRLLTAISLVLAAVSISACHNKKVSGSAEAANASADVRYEVKALGGDSFAYKIYINDTPYIYQTIIPAVQGLRPFKDTVFPGALAERVCQKLSHDELPTFSIAEVNHIHDSIYHSPIPR